MSTMSVNTRRSFKITYLWLTPDLQKTFLVFSKHLAWVITMANGKKVLMHKEILETGIPLFSARPIHARAVNRLFAGTS